MDIIERLKVNVNNLEAAFPQTDTAQLESEAAETIESLRAEVSRLKEIADEYQDWIYFHDSGNGDYSDFCTQQLAAANAKIDELQGEK